MLISTICFPSNILVKALPQVQYGKISVGKRLTQHEAELSVVFYLRPHTQLLVRPVIMSFVKYNMELISPIQNTSKFIFNTLWSCFS